MRGMLQFSLKRLFVSVSLIAIGMGLLAILFRPRAYSPPGWIGRPLWFFGEVFIGIGVLSLFATPVFLGGSAGLLVVLIISAIPDPSDLVRIGGCLAAMFLAMTVFGISIRTKLRQSSWEDLDDLAVIAERREDASIPHDDFMAELKCDRIL